MSALLPCPMCGGTNITRYCTPSVTRRWRECETCRIRTAEKKSHDAAARTLLETAEDMLDESATTREEIRALEDARAALEYLPRREDEGDDDDAGDAA